MSSKSVQVPENMRIQLTETEDQLCSLLDECTRWMRAEKGLTTSCRIAGGWVRDKLLGSDSNDIDIALEDMMGLAFAEHFVDFVANQKHLPVKSITKVESNPDQSKHLETAKTKVLDVELDFVNLRSEEYAGDSRIPTEVTFGTPLQDALRRDITINALFYNVHSRSVEDHTEKGLGDLRSGIIRTPLPPKETFTDDPLRVIRCIRFASRFGFSMVTELQDAASHPDIKHALTQKISRERVGEELHKMMKGRDPLHSLKLIDGLSLYPQIFFVPPSTSITVDPSTFPTSLAAASILHSLITGSTSADPIGSASLPSLHPLFFSTLLEPLSSSASPIPRLYLAAALTPYRNMVYTDVKGRQQLVSEAVLRDGLKLGTQNHYLDGIPALFTAAELLKDLSAEQDRVAIGLRLREKSIHNPITGSHWTTSLLFSLVQELVPLWNYQTASLDSAETRQIVERHNALATRVEELDLVVSVDAKPLLDGREVVRALAAAKPGQWTGHVLARVIEWQLANPAGTKDECAAWLCAERDAGRIVVADAGGTTASEGKAKRGKNSEGAAKKARR